MKVYVNGAWRTVAVAKVFVGGRWRTINRINIYRSGAWRTAKVFAAPLSVAAPNESAELAVNTTRSMTVSTTATPTGGIAPYTYSTTKTGGGTLLNATSANPAINALVSPGATVSAVLTITVTDATGSTASTTATLTLQNFGS